MARKKKAKIDELGELDKAYLNMVGEQRTPKGKLPPALLITLLGLLLVAVLGGGVWLLFSDHWLVMKDVTVAGVSMEGMTKKEAKETLSKLADELYATQTMTITVLDTTVELPGSDAGIQIDASKAINEAYRNTGVFDISAYITPTGEGYAQVVTDLLTQFNAALQPTVETVEGSVPELKTPENVPGQTLVLELGTPQLGLEHDALCSAILSGYGTANFSVTVDCSVIEPEIPTAEALYDKYLTAPINAVMDGKTFAITPETYGYSVDVQQAAQLLISAQYGDTLHIPFTKIVPETTEADILAALYQDILGQCSTSYSGYDNNNRNTNLRLACEKIDGMILLPGETFSYNAALGERTAANGWKPAASYVGGLTVDTYGGGICQGSTTLYNCVLQADLKITECYPHGYISSYIGPGLDASVNWPTADFKFVNTTNWPIKIEAYRRDGKMTMRLYGTDEKNYYVKMTYAVVGSTPYETKYEEIDPENNPKGYKDGQELVSPYTGYRVRTYKNRYDKATDELIETKLERDFTYSHRDRVVVKFKTKEPEKTEEEEKPVTPENPETPEEVAPPEETPEPEE